MRANVLLFLVNLVLSLILLYYIGTRGLESAPSGWEYKDLITIILTALTALLAALAIFIGLLAIWGYASIRDASIAAAESAAEVKAVETARATAETVAARTAEAIMQRLLPEEDRTEEITQALSRKDGNDPF
jgi:hypothetical protein